MNTSVTPFVVSTLEAIRTRHMTMGANLLDPRTKGKNQLVYQVWFDSGGMVENMFYALLGSTGSFAIAQLLPAVTVLKRYVLSLTADSQHRLNELWAPPAMDVGKNLRQATEGGLPDHHLRPAVPSPLSARDRLPARL